MRQRLGDARQHGLSGWNLGKTKVSAEIPERLIQVNALRHVITPAGLTAVVEELANHIHVGLNVVLSVDKGLVTADQHTLHISVLGLKRPTDD